MASCAVDEAFRAHIALGGDPELACGLDNFCWCDAVQSEKTPDGEYKLAQLVRANQALYDYTTKLGVPCISGKDSMKNDYMIKGVKISIPPTLLFSVIAKMDDVRQAITMDAKKPGDLVYILGMTRKELGGSEYFAMHGHKGKRVPEVAMALAVKRYESLHKAIQFGLVSSCHDCSDGGLGVALAETAFSGDLGMEIKLSEIPAEKEMRDDEILFSESQSRFIVTIKPENKEEFEKTIEGDHARIGNTTEEKRFVVKEKSGKGIIDSQINDLKESWQKTLKW